MTIGHDKMNFIPPTVEKNANISQVVLYEDLTSADFQQSEQTVYLWLACEVRINPRKILPSLSG